MAGSLVRHSHNWDRQAKLFCAEGAAQYVDNSTLLDA